MDYLSTVRVLDTDYKIKDEEAARINHTHKIEEIKGAAKEGHKHKASEIDGLSTVATSGSYSDLEGKPSAATDSTDGLMTSADKKKLDGIQAGASSYTHPTHTAHEIGLYKVAVDSLGHVSSATAVTKSDITALGIPAQDTDTTYGEATADAAGLMSAADKSKLDGIQYNHVGNMLSCNISGNAATATEIKAEDGVNASLEKLPQWIATPMDSTQLVRRDTNGTATYGRVTFRTVWNYIKGKADAVYAAMSHVHSALDVQFSPSRASTGRVMPVHAGFMGAGRCLSAFLPPSGIKLEYSNDGGDTWLDYGTRDENKRKLASMPNKRNSYKLGGPNASGALGDMLRVTYEPSDGRYGLVQSALVWVSTMGGSNLLCGVETSTMGAKGTWVERVASVEMSGWPGPNVVDLPPLTFGGYENQTSNTYGWRFTFAKKADVPGKTQEVCTIDLYGTSVWNPVNEMMRSGHLYTWNDEGKGHFLGSADSATKLETARKVTISGAVSGSATWDGSGNINISTTANESYISSPISGLYNMAVDADGNLWVYHSDSDKAPDFEYDSATGNLYYVTEA